MTMNVLASILTPAKAKPAGKAEAAEPGADGDFAALLAGLPSAPGQGNKIPGLKGKLAALAARMAATAGKDAKAADPALLPPAPDQVGLPPALKAAPDKDATDPQDVKDEEAAPALSAIAAAMAAVSRGQEAASSGGEAKAHDGTEAVASATGPARGGPVPDADIAAKGDELPPEGEAGAPTPTSGRDSAAPVLKTEAQQLVRQLKQILDERQNAAARTPENSASGQDGVSASGRAAMAAPAASAAPQAQTQAQQLSGMAPAVTIGGAAPAQTGASGGKGQGQRQGEGKRASVEPTAAPSASAMPNASPFIQTQAAVAAPGSLTPPAGATAQALEQQVVTIAASGQWLDSIGDQINSIASSGGQGRFQIATQGLGQIDVRVSQTDAGVQVDMAAHSQAGFDALKADSDRLVADAQLAAVRIADIRIERAEASADAGQSDLSRGQNGGAQQQNGGQNGQGNGFAAARDFGAGGQGRQNWTSAPKGRDDAAVLNLNDASRSGATDRTDGQGVRYA